MLDHLIQQLGAAGAALILEGGALVLESGGELDRETFESIRQHKPAIIERLQEEQAAHLGLWCGAARRFVGSASCDAQALHKLYLDAVELDYGAATLRITGATLTGFVEAFHAAALTIAPAAVPAPARRGATVARHSDRARARRTTVQTERNERP